MKLGKKEIFLGGWILLLLVGNILWLSWDKNPPAWDQAAHLKGIINSNLWLRGKFWGSFADLMKSFWGYPPLVYWLGGGWSLLVGTEVARITVLNSLFLILGVIGVYKLSGKNLLAAILFSLFPVIYDISRNMLLDLALTVWVIWGLYFWLKRKDLAWLLMLVLASLTKLNGFIYFVPMVIISVWENYKSKEFWARAWLGLMLYFIMVAWWWSVNFQAIFQYLTGLAGQGETATDPMNLMSWVTWIHYFKLFFLQQIGPIVGIIFGISLFWVDFKNQKNKKLWWWLAAIYIIFTVIKNKDFRFTMPLLPVVAVWFGEALTKIKQTWLILVLLGWMGFNYVENSFNWPIRKPVVVSSPTFLLGDINWIDFSDYPVREVRKEVWPDQKILAEIADENSLLVVMNIAELNDNTLQFYNLAGKNNLEIHGIDRWGEREFDYILVPDLMTESAPFYDVQLAKREAIVKEIWQKNNRRDYEIVAEYVLPQNKGTVYLFKVL